MTTIRDKTFLITAAAETIFDARSRVLSGALRRKEFTRAAKRFGQFVRLNEKNMGSDAAAVKAFLRSRVRNERLKRAAAALQGGG
jgi:hypothetical protein